MANWQEYKLGDFADIQTGPFGSQLHAADYVQNGIPSIMPTNIGSRLNIVTNDIVCITEKDAERLKKYTVISGDIVYSRRGDVEKCAFITSEQNGWLCGTGSLRIRFVSNEIEPKFCAYYLSTPAIKSWVLNNSVGSTMPNLNSSILKNLPLQLPPLVEQQAIVKILSSLDDKIDLLHHQNKTLEAMAETLFRQWFIEEAEESWEEVDLEFVTKRITDGSHFSPPTTEVGFPMASVKDMHQWGITTESCRFISKENFDELVRNDCKPLKNDIVIAKDGSYLKHVFVAPDDLDVVILSSIAILRPNGKYNPLLLTIFLKMDSTRNALENIVTGAVIPRIVLKDFRKFKILLPPLELQNQKLETIEPIYLKCWKNVEQINELTKLRDELLPKLMSSDEVRVKI